MYGKLGTHGNSLSQKVREEDARWSGYEKQAEWDSVVDYYQGVWQAMGPFDGLVGYSQGACVAAALAACSKIGKFLAIAFAILYAGDAER